jgi:pyrroloquinoline quinone biosynthesis protein E
VACVQFYGWGLKNQAALQPTRAQVDQAKRVVASARAEWQGRLVIDFVPPDYYADFPKACMGGWGSTGFNITPDGTVLPCHAAATIPSLQFQRVADAALADIWYDGPAFRAYRGTDWMPDTCKSCARRDMDHGGCRCQAMALTGDANAVDPVCRHAPARGIVDRMLADASTAALDDTAFIYRR